VSKSKFGQDWQEYDKNMTTIRNQCRIHQPTSRGWLHRLLFYISIILPTTTTTTTTTSFFRYIPKSIIVTLLLTLQRDISMIFIQFLSIFVRFVTKSRKVRGIFLVSVDTQTSSHSWCFKHVWINFLFFGATPDRRHCVVICNWNILFKEKRTNDPLHIITVKWQHWKSSELVRNNWCPGHSIQIHSVITYILFTQNNGTALPTVCTHLCLRPCVKIKIRAFFFFSIQ